MKLFLYRCPECLVELEYATPNEARCECTGTPVGMIRVYTLSGVRFRGPGFYKTDNHPRTEK